MRSMRCAGEQSYPPLKNSPKGFLCFVASLAALLGAFTPSPARSQANAHASTKGIWSRPFTTGNAAVHFILTPSDEEELHSQVFWWREIGDPNFGGVLKWGIPTSRTDTTSFLFPSKPTGTFEAAGLTAPLTDPFCSNASRLPDGRVFIGGGTAGSSFEVGIRSNMVLDPRTRTFSAGDSLLGSQRRWYPTVTTLGSGRITNLSGSQYFHVHVFGGRNENGMRPDSIARLAVSDVGAWDGSLPIVVTTGSLPPLREMHSFAQAPDLGATMYFGGRQASGEALNDVWFAYRNSDPNDPEYTYTWAKETVAPNVNQSPGLPDARYLTAATRTDANELVVFGGAQEPGGSGTAVVYSDLWVVRTTINSGGQNVYTWYRATQDTSDVQSAGLSIGPRCGATLMREEPSDKPHELLMYGGARGPNETPTDRTVYRLSVTWATNHYVAKWTPLSMTSPAGPGPRTQFSMNMDTAKRGHAPDPNGNDVNHDQYRALMFGGIDSTGHLTNDLWALWDVDSAGTHYGEWQKIITSSGGPSARRRQAMALETHFDRVMMFGGETDLLSTPTRSDEAWSLLLPDEYYYGVTTPITWSSYPGGSQKPLGHIAGMSAEVWGNVVFTRVGDIYDPSQSTGSRWHAFTSAPHLADWYPTMFCVPDASAPTHEHLFEASPRRDSWLFDVDATSNNWQAIDPPAAHNDSHIVGGSAVMYRVSKVMKAGTRDTELPGSYATNKTATIDLGPAPSANASSLYWQQESPMTYPRVNLNLTLLPTGDVMATGGTTIVGNTYEEQEVQDGGAFIYNPELWHPASSSTSPAHWDVMEEDPYHMKRGYHSNCLVLPDSRLLVGSGNVTSTNVIDGDPDTSWHKVQVYSPPFLFSDAAGTPATRVRVLATSGGNLSLGDVMRVQTDLVVDSLVLIRGGSATHGYNSEQRFVPLARWKADSTTSEGGSTQHVYFLRIPAERDSVPPGDYMLFAVKSGYAPSIARWVHIAQTKPDYDIGDVIRPKRFSQHGDGSCYPAALGWTWPADDSLFAVSGKVAGYEVRYSMSATLCDTCWTAYRAATVSYPGSGAAVGDPGTTIDGVTLDDMPAGYTYRVQMLSWDDHRSAAHPWTSPLSSVMTFHVNSCEEAFLGGGDGGGGYFAARRAGASSAASSSHLAGSGAYSPAPETSILDGLVPGEIRTERIVLPLGPADVDSALRVRIRRGTHGAMTLTGARLIAMDVPDSAQAVFLPGRPYAGEDMSVAAIGDAHGHDAAADMLGDASPWHGFAGDTLLVHLGTAPGGSAAGALPVVVRASGTPPEGRTRLSGFLVQARGADGAWQTLTRGVPHDRFTDFAADSVADSLVRIVLLTSLDIASVRRVAPAAQPAAWIMPALRALHHSTLGDFGAGALSPASGLALGSHDTLLVDFERPAADAVAGYRRNWALELTGRSVEAGDPLGSTRAVPVSATPTRFVLEQNHPNPFSGGTALRFGLPRAARVDVQLYDLLGRRVAMIAHGSFEAGWHAVSWGGITAQGAHVAPGVYLCRMKADRFSDVRKWIVVQ